MQITPIDEDWVILLIVTIFLGAYIIGTLAPYILKGRLKVLLFFFLLIASITFWNILYVFAILLIDPFKKYISILLSTLIVPLMIYFWIEFSISYSFKNTRSKAITIFRYITIIYTISYAFFILLDPWYHTVFMEMNYTTFDHVVTPLYVFFDVLSYTIGAFGAIFLIIGLMRKKVRPAQGRLLLASFTLIFLGDFVTSKRILGPLDFSPIISIVVLFILSVWMHKVDIFPFTVKAQNYLFNSVEEAILLLDDETIPLFYNKNAGLYFPEVKRLPKIKDLAAKMGLSDLRDYFEKGENMKFKKEFKLGGFTHSIEITPIFYKKYLTGYIVVIYDVTREAFLRERFEELNATLEDKVREREREIREMYLKRERDLYNMIRSLVDLIDLRDESTGGHSRRIMYYSRAIAEALGLPKKEVERIALAASLHDIGKIGIPDVILKKPGALTKEEYEIIKSHAAIGRELLKKSAVFSHLAEIVGEHHERWDGKGYPDGKKGDEISVGGQILAVADAFEAMTADRVYRRAMSVEEALYILEEGRGKQFSPRIVDVFIHLVRTKKIEAPFEPESGKCKYL